MDTVRDEVPRRFQSGIKITVVANRTGPSKRKDAVYSLRDAIMNSTCPKQRLDTLQKLRNSNHQIFKYVLKYLLKSHDFARIDPLLQIELLDLVQKFRHDDLLKHI
jgi:hypothetical protein